MGMSRFAREALRAFCFALAALAAAGTVLIPIPANARNVAPAAPITVQPDMQAVQTIIYPRDKARIATKKATVAAPLDLAAVAGMAVPADVLARAKAQAAQLASQDTIGVVTHQQIIDFARAHPAFVAKIKHAYKTGTMPQFTAEEQALLAAATKGALGSMKAGSTSGSMSGSGGFGIGGDSNNGLAWVALGALVLIVMCIWHKINGTGFPPFF
jgi:hypothetical protein